jgi:predicted amidohydrolase
MDPITVAIVQTDPVYLDLAQSVAKAVDEIARAARTGAKLVVLGESWLPGYPAWLDYCPGVALWDHEPTKAVFARLRHNSVVVPGPATDAIGSAARDNGVAIVIGVTERVLAGPGSGTLYNSLLTFAPDGRIANHHRKLVPTYTERMVWGQGDAHGLRAVETPAGRVGGLICWEHWMPLARQALHDSGEHVHVAVWPTVRETHLLASRHYAFEGRCFVLAAGLLMRARDLPKELDVPAAIAASPDALLLRGGSAIIGPDGAYLAEPVYDRETILTAELDPTAIDREVLTLDVTGHYSRPDVFAFGVARSRRGD